MIIHKFMSIAVPSFLFATLIPWAAPASAQGQPTAALGAQTGVIVPLYSYPGQNWDDLAAIKTSNPSVPIVAIINPASGPGASQDANYVSGVQDLKAAGIVVIGYVWTNYGDRPTSTVRSEIVKYKNWYQVDGVFFDAMSNLRGKLKYYNNLDNYAKARGLTLTVGNPGTDTNPIYIGSVDNIVIYENAGTPALDYLDGWHSGYDKSNFSFSAYNVPSLDSSFVSSASQYVGLMYITDDNLPNPYDTLPSYLQNLVSALAQPATVSAVQGS